MIGDFIRRKDRDPDGGIGGLTDDELKPWTDLLNAGRCECGACGCGSPLIDPDRRRA